MNISLTQVSTAVLCTIVDHSATWSQAYDPAHHWWLSTFWAALPLLLLLVLLAGLKLKAHAAALIALAVALVVAAVIFHMPAHLALLATLLGAGYGLFPIFWIIFPVIFMYQLTVRAGRFKLLHECLVGVTEDSRLQLLLIAFLFGAFFEGAAGLEPRWQFAERFYWVSGSRHWRPRGLRCWPILLQLRSARLARLWLRWPR